MYSVLDTSQVDPPLTGSKTTRNRDIYMKMKKLLISQYTTPKGGNSNKNFQKHRRLRSAICSSQRSYCSKGSGSKLNSMIERPISNQGSNSNLKDPSLHSILKHLGGSYTDSMKQSYSILGTGSLIERSKTHRSRDSSSMLRESISKTSREMRTDERKRRNNFSFGSINFRKSVIP